MKKTNNKDEENFDKNEVRQNNNNDKRKIDGYITLKNIEMQSQSINNNLKSIMYSESMDRMTKQMKSLIMPAKLYMKNIDQVANALNKTLQSFAETIKPITEAIINFQITMTPYFAELGEALQKAKENPDSLINWMNYYKKLGEYLWTFPFDMDSNELKNILEEVKSEDEFDKYMIKYFNNDKIEKLERAILSMLPKKHKVIFMQIMNSFYNKDYAIANLGITAIIDDLCTYFLEDKGCSKRENLFLPIIEDVKYDTDEKFDLIALMIINVNINKIYEKVDFRKRISITTHKKVRRNTNQHGKRFINKKFDAIMLLNTIYYMLVVINKFSKYKGKVIYVRNPKEMKRANVFKRKDFNQFYLKKKYYREKK